MAAMWFASFSIGWCFFHLFWLCLHSLVSHMGRAWFREWALTGPAGSNHERGLLPWRVNEAIVVDEGRVIRDAIHIECDSGELQVEGIMVPFIITDLRQTAEEGISKGQKEKGHVEEAEASSPAQASRGTSQALHFPAMASRGKQSGSHAQPESNASSHPLPGTSTRSYVSHLRAVLLARAQKHTLACTTGTQHCVLTAGLTAPRKSDT